jgi:quercetin dioxygenase-like cupin family protein
MGSECAVWLMGHKIRPIETDESYGMVEIVSPPHVPGPPPHYHKHEREFFLILKGTLDVMANGAWRQCPAGSFTELAPDTAHTFVNNGEEDVVWITGWRPKGFQRFFLDFGIPAEEPDARRRSSEEALMQRVVPRIESYGMYIARD